MQEQKETSALDDCEVWPEHWDALRLYLACQHQIELSLGGMGGVHYTPARSVNVHQELLWLSLPKVTRVEAVRLFREIEYEALTILNERANRKD